MHAARCLYSVQAWHLSRNVFGSVVNQCKYNVCIQITFLIHCAQRLYYLPPPKHMHCNRCKLPAFVLLCNLLVSSGQALQSPDGQHNELYDYESAVDGELYNEESQHAFDHDEGAPTLLLHQTLSQHRLGSMSPSIIPSIRQRRFPTSAPPTTTEPVALPTMLPVSSSLPPITVTATTTTTVGWRYPQCRDAAKRGCLDAWAPCCPLGDGKATGIACGKSNCDPERDVRAGETWWVLSETLTFFYLHNGS